MTGYGHLCGDVVISSAVRSIKEVFGAAGIVGRIGGDEFMIFIRQLNPKFVRQGKPMKFWRIFGKSM